jgi:hypothetical protein
LKFLEDELPLALASGTDANKAVGFSRTVRLKPMIARLFCPLAKASGNSKNLYYKLYEESRDFIN